MMTKKQGKGETPRIFNVMFIILFYIIHEQKASTEWISLNSF